MKTTNKRIEVMKETGIPPKKRGRPAGSKTKKDKAWEDFMIPTPKELGMHRGNRMSLPDKITLVLTLVNVAILISLVIKNV